MDSWAYGALVVFVVERFVPGVSHEALLAALGALQRTVEDLRRAGVEISYLGSTIVPGDEACYCRFEAPDAGIVADANRRAGVPFDRILPALSVSVPAGSGD